MKKKNSRFDSLVARYYRGVYSFASRFTDDAREAIVLTRDAFNVARKQLRNLRDQNRGCDNGKRFIVRADRWSLRSCQLSQFDLPIGCGSRFTGAVTGESRRLPRLRRGVKHTVISLPVSTRIS